MKGMLFLCACLMICVILAAVPDAPAAPTISDITANFANVSWQAPASDGGSPLLGYFVERQSDISPRWIRINREVVNDVSLPFTDLVEGTEYAFRVIAVNKKGESKPSPPSDNVLAKNPYGMLSLFQMPEIDLI